MNSSIWVVWRDGRMGSWSLAHVADISGNTLCGVDVGEYPQIESNLDGTFTHCSECQTIFDAVLGKIGDGQYLYRGHSLFVTHKTGNTGTGRSARVQIMQGTRFIADTSWYTDETSAVRVAHAMIDYRLDGPEDELSKEQITRQDRVDNAIRALLNELAGKEWEWDIAALAAVREAAEPFVRGATGMSGKEYYPYLEEE